MSQLQLLSLCFFTSVLNIFGEFIKDMFMKTQTRCHRPKPLEVFDFLRWKSEKRSNTQDRKEDDVLFIWEPTEAKFMAISAECRGYLLRALSIYFFLVGRKGNE